MMKAAKVLRLFTRPLLIAALLGSAGCAGNTPSLKASNPPDAYRLGYGDQVAVVVYGQPETSGQFEVDDEGALSLPLAGRVDVRDLTTAQAEQAVAKQLVRKGLSKDPQVTINVTQYRPIYILGEVQKPGAYPYYSGETVLNAVAVAGGYTYRAGNSRIDVIRPTDGQRQPQRAEESSYLAPGDIVVVPERWF